MIKQDVNKYLLETITQISKLTNLFFEVDLSADDLATLIQQKNEVITKLLNVVDNFNKFIPEQKQ